MYIGPFALSFELCSLETQKETCFFCLVDQGFCVFHFSFSLKMTLSFSPLVWIIPLKLDFKLALVHLDHMNEVKNLISVTQMMLQAALGKLH